MGRSWRCNWIATSVGVLLSLGICLHVLLLLRDPGTHFAWKLDAFVQLSRDTFAGSSRHVVPHGPSRLSGKNVIAIETNRQIEIVSEDNPLHSVYVRCCPEVTDEVDLVCTCSDSETFSDEALPIDTIKAMASEVLVEMDAIEQNREEIFNNNSYTQFKWFVDNRENLKKVQDVIFGANRGDSENEASFRIFETKFHLWCEDQEGKGFIERRFNLTNDIREEIFAQTRCEADEYDLEQGCLRKNTNKAGRATNNGILEAEEAEKAKAKARERYESPVALRAVIKVDQIDEELKRNRDLSAEDKENEDTDPGTGETLSDLFQSLDQVQTKGVENLADLVGSCLKSRRLEFLELFVNATMEEEARRKSEQQKHKQAEDKGRERKRKRAEEAKAEAAAQKKAEDAKRRSQRTKRRPPSDPRPKAQPPALNATASLERKKSVEPSPPIKLEPSKPPPIDSPPVVVEAAGPSQRDTSRSQSQRRGRKSKSRSRGSPRSSSASAGAPPVPPSPPGDSPEKSRQFLREKRAKQRKLREDEDNCHSVYQISLKSILTSSVAKKIHNDLVNAETEKQNCLKRARRRFNQEVATIGQTEA